MHFLRVHWLVLFLKIAQWLLYSSLNILSSKILICFACAFNFSRICCRFLSKFVVCFNVFFCLLEYGIHITIKFYFKENCYFELERHSNKYIATSLYILFIIGVQRNTISKIIKMNVSSTFYFSMNIKETFPRCVTFMWFLESSKTPYQRYR